MYSHCYHNRSDHFLRLSPFSVCQLCIIHRTCHMLSEASVPISVCGSTQRHVFINYLVIYLTWKEKPNQTNRENNSAEHNLLKIYHLAICWTFKWLAHWSTLFLQHAQTASAGTNSKGNLVGFQNKDSVPQCFTRTHSLCWLSKAWAHRLEIVTWARESKIRIPLVVALQ